MGAKASKAKQAKDRQGKLDKLAKNMDAAKKLLSGERYQPKLKIAQPPPCGELPLALIGATLRHEQGTQNIMEGATLRISKGMRLIIRGAPSNLCRRACISCPRRPPSAGLSSLSAALASCPHVAPPRPPAWILILHLGRQFLLALRSSARPVDPGREARLCTRPPETAAPPSKRPSLPPSFVLFFRTQWGR